MVVALSQRLYQDGSNIMAVSQSEWQLQYRGVSQHINAADFPFSHNLVLFQEQASKGAHLQPDDLKHSVAMGSKTGQGLEGLIQQLHAVNTQVKGAGGTRPAS
eukprot:525438-Pelagomonas_calceolata.AAC.5